MQDCNYNYPELEILIPGSGLATVFVSRAAPVMFQPGPFGYRTAPIMFQRGLYLYSVDYH